MVEWTADYAHLESPRERRRRTVERMLERFDQLVEEVRQSRRLGTLEAASVLVDVDSRLSERERAMIHLALRATPRALRVLEWFDAGAYPPRLELLRTICLGECGRRLSDPARRRRAA